MVSSDDSSALITSACGHDIGRGGGSGDSGHGGKDRGSGDGVVVEMAVVMAYVVIEMVGWWWLSRMWLWW